VKGVAKGAEITTNSSRFISGKERFLAVGAQGAKRDGAMRAGGFRASKPVRRRGALLQEL
jgi:hypothetical protein